MSGLFAVVGEAGDADAGRDAEGLLADLERPRHGLEQLLGDGGHLRRGPGVGNQDHEFVAAHPGEGVDLAKASLQAQGEGLEKGVPRGVAAGVVDELEPVQVEVHEGETTSVAARLREGELEPLQEEDAIGQFRQGIVIDLLDDPGLVSLAIRDVVRAPRRAGRPSSSAQDPEISTSIGIAVLANRPEGVAQGAPLAFEPLAKLLAEHLAFVRDDELLDGVQAEELPGRIPEDRRELRVDVAESAILKDEQTGRRLLHEVAKLGLGGARKSLRAPAVADLAEDADDAENPPARVAVRGIGAAEPGNLRAARGLVSHVRRRHGVARKGAIEKVANPLFPKLREDLQGAASENVAGGKTREALHRRVPENVAQPAVVDHDAFGGAREDFALEAMRTLEPA